MKSGVISLIVQQQQTLQTLSHDNEPANTGTMRFFFRALKDQVTHDAPEYLPKVTAVCDDWENRGIQADLRGGGLNWAAPINLFDELYAALGEPVAV